MAAAASPSLSATRPPPCVTTTISSSFSQLYYATHNLPGSSSSLSFSSSSVSKSCNFFLLNRTEKRCTRFIHIQACRSLGFPFNSYESTEGTPMDGGHERDRDSQRLTDRIRYPNTAVHSGKGNLKNFGQVNDLRIFPSLPQKQKTINSERSRFMNDLYTKRNAVEPDILGDGIDTSNFFANDEEKQTHLSSQKRKHGVMPQKYMFPQRSHSQNRFYASRSVNHGKGDHDQGKQRSLYSNQLVENDHRGNRVNASKFPANKIENQRSGYTDQQVENGQRSLQNPPFKFSANEQEKQMPLYRDNQQFDNGEVHNHESPNSIAADNNGEQAPVFSSKLEEILAKFKKKPGFHKDPRAVRDLQRGNDYVSSLDSSHPQYIEADMVKDKDVTLNSKKTGRQDSRINLNTSENGRKNGQNHHKQGRRSLFNDGVDIFWKEMPSPEQDDADNSTRKKSHLNVSSSSTPWRMKMRTSTSVGSRSNPSRSSVSRSDAMGMLGETKPSLEKDDVGVSSREKSSFKISDRSPIPWKAGRQHSLAGEPHIQMQKERYTSVSTGSRSNPSSPSVLSSDAKNLRHSKSQSNIDKITEKVRHDEENNEIINLDRTRINNDMSRVNEVGIDTSDSGGEYDSDWSIDLDDNEDDNAVMEHDHHSSMTPPGKTPCPSLSSEVIDSKVSTSSLDKPKVATWHKHSMLDIPFEFEYSYTETPKSPIVRYRETPFSPFGPSTMGRPWTGRAPLKPSKKKLPEFDSFKPPPKSRKGIKFVQDPGPYPEGKGPKPSKTRDEIMGEPLSKEEIAELVENCYKERRQLNLGRDGLTHNMLDLIHCHWKRRRVCKIKCIGVPTLDMDNVCFHVEDKTGGKIIYRTGGILYLYRGRNYNYKDRPKFPLMLWKPVTPVYPKLIQEAPDGLTKEEAKKLRQLGEKVEPMCKLVKNGVYLNLVEDTRAAFKVDKLVRIDCRGMNPSDYKKIGAKLKDLVPCVLLSFDNEHILMWKGIENNSALSNTQAPQSLEQSTILEVSPEDESLSSPLVSFGTLEDENGDGERDSDSFGDGDSDSESGAISHDIVGGSNIVSSLVSSTTEMDNLTEEANDVDLVYSNGQCDSIVLYIDDLWKGAIASGMALELNGNSDSDVVAKQAWELAKSAPAGPSYTEALINKLRLKTEKSRKPDDEVRIHLGKPKKKQNRPQYQSYKTHTVDVPKSGGLPVSELARLLASR